MKNFLYKKPERKKLWIVLAVANILSNNLAYGHEDDDPVIAHLIIDQLELRDTDDVASSTLEAQAWVGKDLNKLWLKTDIEKHSGKTESAELQALYSHAIAPFWDIQIGVKKDMQPTPTRTWGVIGVQGVAPYFFDVNAALFIGESGRTAARLSADYDFLLTQRLILSPKAEINFYGQNDIQTGTGAGLSNITTSLHLGYQIYREFTPYLGINWNHQFGNTEKFSNAQSESTTSVTWVIGLRAWF